MAEELAAAWLEAADADGGDQAQVVASLSHYATVLERRDKEKKAEQVLHRLCEANEMLLGPDHVSTLASKRRLAGVLQRLGKHVAAAAEATELGRRSEGSRTQSLRDILEQRAAKLQQG